MDRVRDILDQLESLRYTEEFLLAELQDLLTSGEGTATVNLSLAAPSALVLPPTPRVAPLSRDKRGP